MRAAALRSELLLLVVYLAAGFAEVVRDLKPYCCRKGLGMWREALEPSRVAAAVGAWVEWWRMYLELVYLLVKTAVVVRQVNVCCAEARAHRTTFVALSEDRRHLLAQKRDVLFEDGGAAVLGDEAIHDAEYVHAGMVAAGEAGAKGGRGRK